MTVPLAESYQEPLVVTFSGHLRTIRPRYVEMMSGPTPPKNLTTDGCTCAPDILLGAPVWVACVWHDWARNPLSDVSKFLGDLCFCWNLWKLSRATGGPWRRARFGGILVYYMAVTFFEWVVR